MVDYLPFLIIMEFKNKHSLGQNFLNNEAILNNIVDSVSVKPNDLIIEIGPGIGALTSKLQNFNCHLLCFEIDQNTKPFLDKIINEKTKIIYEDFLKINLNDYVKDYDVIHIIANIPYYITTPIIEHIINSKVNVMDMTLMVQEEVANRLTAIPNSRDYGYFTVYLNYYYQLKKLFVVNRNNFNPIPNVDSAVIQLIRRNTNWNLKDEQVFFKLIKDAFRLKRKNLRNNLKTYDLVIINDVLKSYNLDLTARAEALSIQIFIEIANKITI